MDLENKENNAPLIENLINSDQVHGKLVATNDTVEIQKLKQGIKVAQEESIRKNQCIERSEKLKMKEEREKLRYVQSIWEFELALLINRLELIVQTQLLEQNQIDFVRIKKDHLDISLKIEETKELLKVQEAKQIQMTNNFGFIEKRIAFLQLELNKLEPQFEELNAKVNEEIEKGEYKRDAAALEYKKKRLEIKIASLEQALQHKVEECVALSGLHNNLVS